MIDAADWDLMNPPSQPGAGQQSGTGQQPGQQPTRPRDIRELLEEWIRRMFGSLPDFEDQLKAVGDWMYKWDPVNQRWVAKAVGAMSEEERQALKAQGFMSYDDASVFSKQTHGVVSPVHPEVYRTQISPQILQQLATQHGMLLPFLQLLAQIESAEARGGGGGGFLDFLGKLVGLVIPFIRK